MNRPESEKSFKAMDQEMEMLESSMDLCKVFPRREAKGSNVLDKTWTFQTKWFPDGKIRKYKARICVHRDQQQHGYNFLDTYAPVVQWSTVRLLLILTATLGL